MTTNHHYMMFFTNTGRVKTAEGIRRYRRQDVQPGEAIINLLQLMPEDRPLSPREFNDDKYLFMATGSMVKKHLWWSMSMRKNGLQAIVLRTAMTD